MAGPRPPLGAAGGTSPGVPGPARPPGPTRAVLDGGDSGAGDDGRADPALLAALLDHREGRLGRRGLVAALAGQRLLVPLLEVGPDRLEQSAVDPCSGSDRAMAAVSLTGQDGTQVGLAFSGLSQLAAWNRQARPLPTAAERAAAAVIGAGGRLLIIDSGSPTAVEVAGAGLLRLAAGEPWPVPWADPQVQRAVVAELAPALASGDLAVRLLPGPSGSRGPDRGDCAHPARPPDPQVSQGVGPSGDGQPSLLVELRFRAGTSGDVAAARAKMVATRLGRSPLLAEVLDDPLAVGWTIAG